ncbi:MAG: DUF3341 domain-containing protein [Pirellulales bacterium]|nr:DUF3341 domain-containing protein [Pirellulales bacterium]
MESETGKTEARPVLGLLAEFDGPEGLRRAAAAVREAGYARFEAYSPVPVHGLDAAMGRKRTKLPMLVLGGGLAGCAAAILLQWWTNAVDYPFLISGKPYFSLPANIPVAFEMIILFAALAAFGGGLALSGLPRLFSPLASVPRFRRATTDRFFLTIDAADPKYDETTTADLLRSLGAGAVETFEQPATTEKVPPVVIAVAVVLIAATFTPPLWLLKARYTRSAEPRVHLVLDMDFQPKYLPQQASPLFADGRDMRPPVEGAIAAGAVIDNEALLTGETDGKLVTKFPVPVTRELIERGRQRYDIYCATCHGLAGDGDGPTSALAFEREEKDWGIPTSMHSELVRTQPVGEIFRTITQGIRKMPSYASQIPVGDRWAIVAYVRALQRTRMGTLDDVPEEIRTELKKKAGLKKEKKEEKEPRMNADGRK